MASPLSRALISPVKQDKKARITSLSLSPRKSIKSLFSLSRSSSSPRPSPRSQETSSDHTVITTSAPNEDRAEPTIKLVLKQTPSPVKRKLVVVNRTPPGARSSPKNLDRPHTPASPTPQKARHPAAHLHMSAAPVANIARPSVGRRVTSHTPSQTIKDRPKDRSIRPKSKASKSDRVIPTRQRLLHAIPSRAAEVDVFKFQEEVGEDEEVMDMVMDALEKIQEQGNANCEGMIAQEIERIDTTTLSALLDPSDATTYLQLCMDMALEKLEDLDEELSGYRVRLMSVEEDKSVIISDTRTLFKKRSMQRKLAKESRRMHEKTEARHLSMTRI
ncbi:hypothetical protein L198_02798 [Cryptococcus wingfieldii CBS 7118]|uniref:Uncharacterized protein n=1 Tax=Cryptococcus wingfieldii CBS 7118 TaxID=1295528 RepID=A0A1E3JPJ8_9TREE|nr:hypothetical protein L198_02798 [Cryptococcus wingfieldii CBS 7118]ODO02067.1 hypothetical protein L198_02798 [Cryptococcus wingfieldii CBS 7118]